METILREGEVIMESDIEALKKLIQAYEKIIDELKWALEGFNEAPPTTGYCACYRCDGRDPYEDHERACRAARVALERTYKKQDEGK